MKNDKNFMKKAIKVAKEGIKSGKTPFGVVIVKDNKVIAKTHNQVWSTTDSTAHAEIKAIQEACKNVDSIDLSGATIYSTCEPCPMCFSAIHWAKIDRVVYGASINDAKNAGFNELSISNKSMKKLGKSRVKIAKRVLKNRNRTLFDIWKNSPKSKSY
jgi:tRNA(Arg) A34 adenosine deaminase TadA